LNNSITFVDLDETLFFTKAKIIIKDENGNISRKLTNQEYNTYIASPGEVFDFSEFLDTDIFVNTSVPNAPMIKILQKLFENTKTTNSEVYLLTARQDFDDKDKFLEFLVKHGIEAGHKDDQKVHVIRAGNLPGLDNASKKYHIIKKMLIDNTQFKKVRLYDDSRGNIDAFLELILDYPEISFDAFYINNGSIELIK